MVDSLAADLRSEISGSRGFSPANLRCMRAFAGAWPHPAILQRVVGKLPWGRNMELLGISDPADRLRHAGAAPASGWSRPVLAAQADSRLHERHRRAVTSFDRIPSTEGAGATGPARVRQLPLSPRAPGVTRLARC